MNLRLERSILKLMSKCMEKSAKVSNEEKAIQIAQQKLE